MHLTKLILLTATFLCFQNTEAQSGNSDLQKALNNLNALLKKHKKDSTATNSSSPPPSIPSVKNGLQAGSILPGAKYIDADQLDIYFHYGSAVIRKGTSSALIDSGGNFIVPYNKVDFYSGRALYNTGYQQYFNELLYYKNTDHQWGGYMNSAGKIIATEDVNTMYRVTDNNRMLWITTNNGNKTYTTTYITTAGKRYKLPADDLADIIDGIGYVRKKDIYGSYTFYAYKKITGEMLTNYVFDEAYHFSNGLAVVGKKDNFGQVKYGYINEQGKQVIPFLFSVKPSDFISGFAKVVPKDKSEFEYAFIDKTGTIVFKQTLNDTYKYGTFDHFTNYGLSFSNGKYIMDTAFNMLSKAAFFKSFGIPADSWFIQEGEFMEDEKSPKLVFSTRGAISPVTKQPVVGFINLTTKKVVMPVFDLINLMSIYFDPATHLAYAKVCTGKNNQGGLIYREGYINEDGLFVLVKGESAKW